MRHYSAALIGNYFINQIHIIMKRLQLFAAAKRVFAVFAATLLFAGCEELFPGFNDPKGEQITITATTEKAVSRTTLNASDEVVWQTDDSILFYDMATGVEIKNFKLTAGVGTTSGSFTGEKPSWEGSTWVYYGDVAYGVGSAKVPATQKYVDGGFAVDVNPMAAVCENLENGVQFKNAAGIIEFQIKGTQTLASIEVSAKEPLSGYYDIDLTTFEKSNSPDAVSEGSNVTLTDINCQLSESAAKNFKVVVMPGTYTEFTVKMTNVDGSVVTKTAEESIVVERSKITPIAGLVDSAAPVEKPKYVNLHFVEANTCWHHIQVKTQRTTYAANHILYMWATDEFLDEWMKANPNKELLDMMISEGSIYSQDIDFEYDAIEGTTYNFYALGLYIDESQETYMVGDVEHISYTSQVPYDANATVSITVPAETITEGSAVAHITPSTPFSRVYVSFYSAAVDTNNSQELIYYNVYKNGGVIENVTSTVEAPVENLAPESNYVVYAIGETADGKLTPLAKQFFTTTAHTEAAVTATATIAEIKEWSASFNVTMSQGAVGYKVGYWTKDTVDLPANADIDWAYQVSVLEGMATGSTFTLINLNEETAYTAFFIAYDANNHYGPVSRVDFTTNAIVPAQNIEGYNAMLGNWTLSYIDAQNTKHEDDITITISENVAGKTLNIKGLLGAGGSVYGGGGDDTVIARYHEDGSIQIDWGKGVADPSNYGQAYDIYCSLLIGTSIYYQGPQIWANEQGVYKIGHPSDPTNSGYAFGAWSKTTGNFEGVIGGAHYDVVMKKVVSKESSASTEKFNRQETVSPTWKSANALRLEKNGFTPINSKALHTLLIK